MASAQLSLLGMRETKQHRTGDEVFASNVVSSPACLCFHDIYSGLESRRVTPGRIITGFTTS